MKKRPNRRRRWLFLSVTVVIVSVGLWLLLRGTQQVHVPVPGLRVAHIPVIDAGHGGEDGGASSDAGAREADLNLQVSAKIDALMRFYGVPSVMVRTEDISLHDASAQSLRDKKRSDLNNRVKLVEGIPNAALISVHQNTFSEPQYSGLHAFFGKAHGSKELAEMIQSNTKTHLDSANNRVAAPVRTDVFLMNRAACPAVLVECGFLSNPGEESRLRDNGYQTKLAATVAASFLQWELAGQGGAPD